MDTALPPILLRGGIPNALIRGALFTTKSMGDVRPRIEEVCIQTQGGYRLVYEGEELNQYDSQVLYAVLYLQGQSGLPLGSKVTINQSDILDLVGRKHGGSSYEEVHRSIKRMCKANIQIYQGKDSVQREYCGHIVDRLYKDDRGHLCFTLNPDLADLFSTDCTIMALKNKVRLKKLLSKWLYDFTSSHTSFFPYTTTYLMLISGYPNSKSEFTRQLRSSCEEIMSELKNSNPPFVQFTLESGKLNLYKTKQKSKGVPSALKSLFDVEEEEIDPFA